MDAGVRKHDEDVCAVPFGLRSRVAAVARRLDERLDCVRVEGDPDRAEDLLARRVDEVGPYGRHAESRYRAWPTLPAVTPAYGAAVDGERAWRCSLRNRSASSAAMQPEPAAVTACR